MYSGYVASLDEGFVLCLIHIGCLLWVNCSGLNLRLFQQASYCVFWRFVCDLSTSWSYRTGYFQVSIPCPAILFYLFFFFSPQYSQMLHLVNPEKYQWALVYYSLVNKQPTGNVKAVISDGNLKFEKEREWIMVLC